MPLERHMVPALSEAQVQPSAIDCAEELLFPSVDTG